MPRFDFRFDPLYMLLQGNIMLAGFVWNFFLSLLIAFALMGCGREKTYMADRAFEASDKVIINKVFFVALNEAVSEDRREWYNSETGNSGAIELLSTYMGQNGQYCRLFREEIEIPRGAIPDWYEGRACRNNNNIWIRQ